MTRFLLEGQWAPAAAGGISWVELAVGFQVSTEGSHLVGCFTDCNGHDDVNMVRYVRAFRMACVSFVQETVCEEQSKWFRQ
eukprot:686433-Alexandrium_andersonii.AAC.1